MQPTIKIVRIPAAGKVFLGVGMMFLLLLLTSINFFIYSSPDYKTQQVVQACTGNEDSSDNYPCNPAGPDEKSPNSPVSLTEEYIHDGEQLDDPFWTNSLFQHMIHEAEKLCIVHCERFSPPPEA